MLLILLIPLLMTVSADAERRMISYPGIGPHLFEVTEVNDVYQEVTRDNTYRVVSFLDTLDSEMRWTLLVDRDPDDDIDVMIISNDAYVSLTYQIQLREVAFKVTTNGLRNRQNVAAIIRQRYPELITRESRFRVILCDEGQAIGSNGAILEYPRAKAQADAEKALVRAMVRREEGEMDAIE